MSSMQLNVKNTTNMTEVPLDTGGHIRVGERPIVNRLITSSTLDRSKRGTMLQEAHAHKRIYDE